MMKGMISLMINSIILEKFSFKIRMKIKPKTKKRTIYKSKLKD
jgi:hypothetical protein